MSQILKLKDTDNTFRRLVESSRQNGEECFVQDERGDSVAVVLPMELYRLYQQEWEEDFADVDRVREKMKHYDPEFVEGQIAKAIAEVKAESDASNTT